MTTINRPSNPVPVNRKPKCSRRRLGVMSTGRRIGDAIVLTPQRLELDALRKEFRRLMKKHRVTPDDLLRDL